MALVRGAPAGLILGPISTERLKNELKVRTRAIAPLVSRGIEARGEGLLRALLARRAEGVGSFVLAVLIISRIPRLTGFLAAPGRRGGRGASNLMRAAYAHVAGGVGAVGVRRVAVRLGRVAVRRRARPPGAKHRRLRRTGGAVALPFWIAGRRPIPAPGGHACQEERTGKQRRTEPRGFLGDLVHPPRMQRMGAPVLRARF